jgi:hypothetical protein
VTKKRLPQKIVQQVQTAIDELFDRLKHRFLGPKSVGDKRLFIEFNRHRSLPGLYEAAHVEERGYPNLDQLDTLIGVAENHIEALRHKTHAKVTTQIRAAFAENQDALQEQFEREMSETFDEVASQVRRIVDTESQNTRNVGVIDGIVRANAHAGVEDPVVFFVTVRDKDLCEECKRLHLMEDGKTPRLWYMSELGHGWHTRGEPNPKVGGLHPHCRCSMTTLMPGFGFDAGGRVVWVKSEHNELGRQRHSD